MSPAWPFVIQKRYFIDNPYNDDWAIVIELGNDQWIDMN